MRRLAILFGTLAAGLLAACGGSDDASRELAFTVNLNGVSNVWLMDEDGSDRRQLTFARPTAASGNTDPVFSPHGERIAFVSTGDPRAEDERDREIFVMDADGDGRTRLTRNRELDADPAWSPDGRRLAFVRIVGWGTSRPRAALNVMNADGSGVQEIYRPPSSDDLVFVATPTWSPSGDRIAFSLARFDEEGVRSGGVYVVRSDGSGARLLARDGGDPDWSPDGKRIAFASVRDRYGETCFQECAPSAEIYAMDANGHRLRRLTVSAADDSAPAWAPDGRSLAFTSDRADRFGHRIELYTMDSRGTELRRLTNTPAWELDPDWRP